MSKKNLKKKISVNNRNKAVKGKKPRKARIIVRVRKTAKKVFLLKKKMVAKKKNVGVKVKKTKALKIERKKLFIPKKFARKSAGIKIKKTEKKKEETATKHSLAESFFKAKIRVIGIGGGGGSIVSEIGRSLSRVSFVIADTDARAFKKRRGIKSFLFGQEMTHGLGTGLNVGLARAAAEKEKEKIIRLFEGQDIVIFIASLGGGLGSGAAQVFAETAKGFGGISFGIFTLPFKFEGKSKQKIAAKALRELKGALNVSLAIPNERIFKIISENTPITEAFSMVNKNLAESLESLIDLIYNPGVINIDFADLKTILRGAGNSAFLNTVEFSGKERTEKTIQEILRNPLYQENNFKAEKILFNIAGGGDLSMFEVDRISKAIAEKNPGAKIIFGISKSGKSKGKIKTTVLMTGASVKEDEKKIAEKSPKKKLLLRKAARKIKPVSRENSSENSPGEIQEVLPVSFGGVPAVSISPYAELSKINIAEEPRQAKKTIRRTALEIKKAQEVEESEKSAQEKEWEIPAFLRFKK